MPSRASYSHYSCYPELNENLLVGGGAARYDLAGAKNTTSNAISCSCHERFGRRAGAEPDDADRRTALCLGMHMFTTCSSCSYGGQQRPNTV